MLGHQSKETGTMNTELLANTVYFICILHERANSLVVKSMFEAYSSFNDEFIEWETKTEDEKLDSILDVRIHRSAAGNSISLSCRFSRKRCSIILWMDLFQKHEIYRFFSGSFLFLCLQISDHECFDTTVEKASFMAVIRLGTTAHSI